MPGAGDAGEEGAARAARRAARVRRFLRWLLRLRGSPAAIARGAAIGTFVAFTPTIGFQMLIAVGIATVLNANRPMAALPTWLTNPFTIPPVFAGTYWLGSLFWPGPEASVLLPTVREAAARIVLLDWYELWAQLSVLMSLGRDVFFPMWIGGVLVGAVAAPIAYFVTFHSIVRLHAIRANRRATRRATRRAQRRAKQAARERAS